MRFLPRRFRYFFRLLAAFLAKHQKLILLSFVIGIISYLTAAQIYRNNITQKTKIIAIIGRYQLEEIPLEIQSLISQGLTTVAAGGEVQPGIAESWEITNDGKDYLFTLKKGLFWHDKKPITANDINYQFSDVTAAAINDQQIIFKLKEPFSPFLTTVSRPVFKKGLIGNGQYRLIHLKKQANVIRSISLFPTNKNNHLRLIYKFYPTEETAKEAFKLGEVNTLTNLLSVDDFKNWKRISLTPQVKTDRLVTVFFNTDLFADKSIRQALAYALVKDWSSRALTPVSPNSWAYNPEVKKYDYDLEKAKNILADSGNNYPKEIEISTLSPLLDTAQTIKNNWEKLGLVVKLKTINDLADDFQVMLITQAIPIDPDQYLLWHSTSVQKLNISHYKSLRVDRLLEDGRKTADLAKRKEIYFEFQKVLLEDLPAIFLYYPTVYEISR